MITLQGTISGPCRWVRYAPEKLPYSATTPSQGEATSTVSIRLLRLHDLGRH